MQTYWLYYGRNPIFSVRGPSGLSDADVRAKALDQHNSLPLCQPMAPFEFVNMLHHATVEL